MKKTKSIKLVLVTGLIISGGLVFANKLKNNVSNLKANNIMPTGYYFNKDTVSHSGSSFIPRSGFGTTGHHSHAAS